MCITDIEPFIDESSFKPDPVAELTEHSSKSDLMKNEDKSYDNIQTLDIDNENK